MIREQLVGTGIFGMGFKPAAPLLRHRLHIHRNTQAVLQPVVGLRQEETGQIEGLLHTDTSVRKGAPLTIEGSPIIGVVQIDRKIVGEPEHDTPQGVACPTLLYDTHLPRAQLIGRDRSGGKGIT